MAQKPTTKPTAEDLADHDVTVKVMQALIHNGEDYDDGDMLILPMADAAKLRALGVVEFGADDVPAGQ